MKIIDLYYGELQSKSKHLEVHPNYLPHIGLKYNDSRVKTLIIAESHFVPEVHNNKFSADDWYSNPEKVYKILDKDKGWFKTRGVIKYYQNYKKLAKGHTIFNNLEKVYKEVFPEIDLFDECVFFNYFQRPAEKQGDSIIVHKKDSEIALENLMVINEVLKPGKIIFASYKAFEDFKRSVSKEQKEQLPYVGNVPHPGSSWWNTKCKKYGLKGIAVTGKEKFKRIVTPKQ